jgi:CheY-like chemotaxis protein
VATGKVTAMHKKRRRRVEFLDFMNEIVTAYRPRPSIVLDNINTHKPKNDQWLKRHRNVRFHFTPTRASWLNQVEIWFSILQGKSLHGASFTSVQQLRDHIDAFIKAYNENAGPRQPALLIDQLWSLLFAPGQPLDGKLCRARLWNIFMKNDIAIILIDVVMPDLDGFELAAMIRAHPRFQKIAMIFVSAQALSDIDRVKAYEHGAVDFVPADGSPATAPR